MLPIAVCSAAAVGPGVATVGMQPQNGRSRRSPLVVAHVCHRSAIPPARGTRRCSRRAFGGLGTVTTVYTHPAAVSTPSGPPTPSRYRPPAHCLRFFLPPYPPLAAVPGLNPSVTDAFVRYPIGSNS